MTDVGCCSALQIISDVILVAHHYPFLPHSRSTWRTANIGEENETECLLLEYKSEYRSRISGIKRTFPTNFPPNPPTPYLCIARYIHNFVKGIPEVNHYIHFFVTAFNMSFELSNETLSFSNLMAKIEQVGKLQSLSLDSITLEGDEDDLQAFSKFFRGHSHLETVRFRNIKFSNQGIDLELVLSMLLISTEKLSNLTVEECSIKSSVITAITYNSTLDSLGLVKCGLKDENAMKLIDALAKASQITSVDVSGNNFTDFGIHAFTQGLKQRTKVTNVQIDGVIKNGEGNVMKGSAQTVSAKSA